MKSTEFYSTNKIDARRGRGWLQTIFNLLYPVRCSCCGVFVESCKNGTICESCLSKFTFLSAPQCKICGLAFFKFGGGDHKCGGCRAQLPYFAKARSLVRYSSDIGLLIRNFKFSGDLSSLETFSMWAENGFISSEENRDYILPVPLHSKRIKERGFNQASLLSAAFFPKEKHKIKHFLTRVENTISQTKLDGKNRRKNLKNCFKVTNKNEVKGKAICIVDDVYTTGTTVNECAKVLMEAGAKRVEVFTLAMVVKENE